LKSRVLLCSCQAYYFYQTAKVRYGESNQIDKSGAHRRDLEFCCGNQQQRGVAEKNRGRERTGGSRTTW
jgi:hypothetical protein